MRKSGEYITDKIKGVASQVLPKGAHLMLYGSRARGDNRKDSDWDLLITLDKSSIEQQDYQNIVFPITMLGWELQENFVPVLYTNDEWDNSKVSLFYKNVSRDAIMLV